MLIGFLITSQDDWLEWRRCVKHVQGKAVIHVADHNVATTQGPESQREDAIDEVETLSDNDSDVVIDV